MCGIVGVLNPTGAKAKIVQAIFSELVCLDTMRGYNSTGVCIVSDSGVETYKRTLPGYDFVRTKTYHKLLDSPNIKLLIGHNRAATQGTVTQENAHPFIAKGSRTDLVLVHNGTVWRKNDLLDGTKYDTDSEAIANYMANHTVKETAAKIDGSASLVWYEAVDDSLNFLRNKDRPMEFAWDAEDGILFFASERRMLEYAMYKYGVIPTKQSYTTPIEKHIKFTLNDSMKSHSEEWADFYKFHSEWKQPAYGRSVHQHQSNYPDAGKDWDESGSNDSGTCLITPPKNKREVKQLIAQLKNKEIYWEITDIDDEAKAGEATLVGIMTHDPNLIVNCYSRQTRMFRIGDIVASMYSGYSNVKSADNYREIELTVGKPRLVNSETLQKKPKLALMGPVMSPEMNFDAFVMGPRGIAIPLDSFKQIVSKGCANCTGNIFPEAHKEITWTEDGQPMCKECSEKLLGQIGQVAH